MFLKLHSEQFEQGTL